MPKKVKRVPLTEELNRLKKSKGPDAGVIKRKAAAGLGKREFEISKKRAKIMSELFNEYRKDYKKKKNFRARTEMLKSMAKIGYFNPKLSRNAFQVFKESLTESRLLAERLAAAQAMGSLKGKKTAKKAMNVLLETLEGKHVEAFNKTEHLDHLRRNAAISLKKLAVRPWEKGVIDKVLTGLKKAKEKKENYFIKHHIEKQIKEIEKAFK